MKNLKKNSMKNFDNNDYEVSINHYIYEIKKEIKKIKEFKSDPDLYLKIFIIEIINEWTNFYEFVLERYCKENNKADPKIIGLIVSNINNLKYVLFLINELQLGE
tara:strand:+ start:133 stop:447 length:315 start_codon:yes stop_codon:yes gene_type:complete